MYPFQHSKNYFFLMCTVKKSEILMISLHLKNEKRYRKNCYAFGIHKKQSFWSKMLAKIGKF